MNAKRAIRLATLGFSYFACQKYNFFGLKNKKIGNNLPILEITSAFEKNGNF